MRADLMEAELGLTRALMDLGRFDDAVAAAQRAIALRGGDWRGYRQLGWVYYRHGEYARAVEPARVVTRLAPDSAWGYGLLGAALFQMDRFEGALDAFEQGAAIHPSPEALWNVGAVQFYLQRFADAARTLEAAVALAPGDATAWGNLGSALGQVKGREAESVSALERACTLMRERLDQNPEDRYGWARLADWSAMLGRRDAAMQAAERARVDDDNDPSCLQYIGTAYLHLGDRQSAIDCYRSMLRRGYGVGRLLRDPYLREVHEEIASWKT
jgi:tetratricopeptide (TPR) repeat protein